MELKVKVLIFLLCSLLVMWRLGFVFHEMAFGLLSVFLPLYIVAIGGSLIDVGVMSAAALFLAIPASFFWGYICDKTRHYKRFILLSFLSSAVILYLFTLTSNVTLLIILYAVMAVLHIAHEPPKNVLIAELYTRGEWEKTFALYEEFTEIGWLSGLLFGLFMSIYGASAASTLFLCSSLNLAAFVLSILFVEDPIMIFERGLVAIEKTIDFACKGVAVASRIFDGAIINGRVERENVNAFCGGLILFSLATSMLFTPMPVFLSRGLAFSQSLIFALYVLNSSGSVLGYFFTSRRSDQRVEKAVLNRIAVSRSVLTSLLIIPSLSPIFSIGIVAVILGLMGFIYALFLVYTLALSMELLPKGKAGLFNALVGAGSACGSFIGPLLAEKWGFAYTFLASSIIFLLAYIAFKIFD
ncbi:MAG: MFS transporter [Candidatus Bathyarchaeia archaeon]